MTARLTVTEYAEKYQSFEMRISDLSNDAFDKLHQSIVADCGGPTFSTVGAFHDENYGTIVVYFREPIIATDIMAHREVLKRAKNVLARALNRLAPKSTTFIDEASEEASNVLKSCLENLKLKDIEFIDGNK